MIVITIEVANEGEARDVLKCLQRGEECGALGFDFGVTIDEKEGEE